MEGAVDALGRQLLQIRKTILAGSCTPNHDCKGMEAVIYLPVDPNLACRRGGGSGRAVDALGRQLWQNNMVIMPKYTES